MKVSIITSAFNCEQYLKEMLNSIITQTYKDWEMILFDDASDDDTWNVIEDITDARIIKIRNTNNVGLTKNLNRALEIAKGKYIVRMDADDIAAPDRIEKQVQFMEANEDVVLSGGWMQCFGGMHDISKTHLNDEDIRIDLIINTGIMHPTFIIRNSAMKKNGIKYNEDLKYAQDYYLVYQLSQYGKLANIPEILVQYRVHKNQIGIKCNSKQRDCADVTRNKILRDMGIELNNNELKVWSNYCYGEISGHDPEEKKLLQNIIDRMISNNNRKTIYNSKKLKNKLEENLDKGIACEETRNDEMVLETEKYQRMFCMMSRWMMLKQKGKNLEDWFIRKGFRSIAIYGMGDAGECLVNELKNGLVHISYGIDRNSGIRCSLKEVVSPDGILKKVDAIIITAISYSREIKTQLSPQIDCPLISLEDIIYDFPL